MASPIPVISCGLVTEVALAVKKALEPEYEVIHIVLSHASAIAELPSLLLPPNHNPPASVQQPQYGTQNYSAPARGIVLGRGFTEVEVSAVRAACTEAGVPNEGWGFVPWVRADPKIVPGPMNSDYGGLVAKRLKDTMERLRREGKFEVGRQEGGSEWY